MSGQASTDTNVYSLSTALGYGATIAGSNQIVLGTASETVYVPNALMLAGVNITSVISTAISSAFTTFLSSSDTFTGTLDTFGAVAVTSLNIGTSTLTSGLITYLSNLTSDPQTQLNALQSYSGKVLQMKLFNNQNGTLSNTSVNASGNVSKTIFTASFTTKSGASQIYASFDTQFAVSGSGSDNWFCNLVINSNDARIPSVIAGYKTANFGQDNRNCSISLFPVSGVLSNTIIGQAYTISVVVGCTSGDDTFTMYNQWNMAITEVQN